MTYTKSHTPRATPSHGTSLVIAQDVLGFPSLRSFFIRPNDHADTILVMFINFTARAKVFGTEWEKNVDVYELCVEGLIQGKTLKFTGLCPEVNLMPALLIWLLCPFFPSYIL